MLYTKHTMLSIILPSNFSFNQSVSDNFQLLSKIIWLMAPNIGQNKQTKYNQEYIKGKKDSCKRIP